eukprot:TRINITY_DN12775_c2_g1_i4.p2 TRINITY_DN12775_c2_g1~~TRINITY_DN12775_c2_g1_i4.p2  ORF type:complete len:304 (-),score=15.13 TRINITY_DN12775_c2_g1_i4:688-1599(-)
MYPLVRLMYQIIRKKLQFCTVIFHMWSSRSLLILNHFKSCLKFFIIFNKFVFSKTMNNSLQTQVFKESVKVVIQSLINKDKLSRAECGAIRLICRDARAILDMSVSKLQVKGTYLFQLQEVLRLFVNVQLLDLRNFSLFGSSKATQFLVLKLLARLKNLQTIIFANDVLVQQLVGFDHLYQLRSCMNICLHTCSYQGLQELVNVVQIQVSQGVNINELHVTTEMEQLRMLNIIFGQNWGMNKLIRVKQLVVHVFAFDETVVEGMRPFNDWLNSLEQVQFTMYGVPSTDMMKMIKTISLTNLVF